MNNMTDNVQPIIEEICAILDDAFEDEDVSEADAIKALVAVLASLLTEVGVSRINFGDYTITHVGDSTGLGSVPRVLH